MQRPRTYLMQGGMDLVTPKVAIRPGTVFSATNYEPDTNGYTRCSGYERFDGRPAPSTGLDATETEALRSAITEVPGTGPVRGVTTFRGKVYAFRDDGDTSCRVFVATGSGWSEVDMGTHVEFNNGSEQVFEGDTITQGGVTAKAKRVVVNSGTWSGDATGWITLDQHTGGSFSDGPATSSGGGSFDMKGPESNIKLNDGSGKFRFTQKNFHGSDKDIRLYFAYGDGRAMEFNGEFFSIIRTGLKWDDDKPTHVGEFGAHLILGYSNGALMLSETGFPTQFQAIGGAAEYSFGRTITNFIENSSTSFIITGSQKTGYLTGTSTADFVLSTISDEAGALTDTGQLLDKPTYVDHTGIRDLTTTQAFGNWRMASRSQQIDPLMKAIRESGKLPVGSLRVKNKDQYRVFYDDGSGLTLYVGRKNTEILPFAIPEFLVCFCSGEDSEGREKLYAGDEDGFVFQMDSGTSFDGDEIYAKLRLHFISPGNHDQNFRYHSITADIGGGDAFEIGVTTEFSYGSPHLVSGLQENFNVPGSGGFWGDATWNQFLWSAQVQGQAKADIDGLGTNCSVCFISQSSDEQPHTLTALRFNTSVRGMIR